MSAKGRITSRLETWREIVAIKPEVELEEVAAGRDAEKLLKTMVSSHLTWKTATIFHSKKIPKDPRGLARGRYEIDLIMISPKQISAIEIKNWSGRLRIDGEKWIQEKKDGREVVHENPLAKNSEKLDCLCALLEARGIKVPSTKICRVIFWNRNLSIPLELAQRDEIVMNHELQDFLSQQKATGFAERFMISVLELCLSQENSSIAVDGFFKSVPSNEYLTATRVIDGLETFDKIELVGGRVISGDLLELRTQLFGYRSSSEPISLKLQPSGTQIKVQCKRDKLSLFFRALLGSGPLLSLGPPFDGIWVSPSDKVLFHAAGEPKPQEIEIARIVRMVRG